MEKYLTYARDMIKPYTFMLNIGQISEKLCVRKSDFMYTDGLLKIIDHELRDIIFENQQLSLNSMFENLSDAVNTAIGLKKFALTFYLLSMQISNNICSTFSLNDLRLTQWNLNFENFAQDLIIIQLLYKLFP